MWDAESLQRGFPGDHKGLSTSKVTLGEPRSAREGLGRRQWDSSPAWIAAPPVLLKAKH
jgi:hypothetical protein